MARRSRCTVRSVGGVQTGTQATTPFTALDGLVVRFRPPYIGPFVAVKPVRKCRKLRVAAPPRQDQLYSKSRVPSNYVAIDMHDAVEVPAVGIRDGTTVRPMMTAVWRNEKFQILRRRLAVIGAQGHHDLLFACRVPAVTATYRGPYVFYKETRSL